MPFREEVYTSNRPLRIGYYESDGYIQPSPSMARAVIPFSIPQAEYAIKDLEGDIVDPSIKGMVNQLCLPDPFKCFSAWIPKYIDPRTSQHLEEIRGVGTPKKLWEQHTAVEEYEQEFIAKWSSLDLDVLLVPVLGSAFYIGSSSLASESQSYMTLYNLLDFPAGVVPVTIVTLQDEEELAFYKGCYGDSSDKNFSEELLAFAGLVLWMRAEQSRAGKIQVVWGESISSGSTSHGEQNRSPCWPQPLLLFLHGPLSPDKTKNTSSVSALSVPLFPQSCLLIPQLKCHCTEEPTLIKCQVYPPQCVPPSGAPGRTKTQGPHCGPLQLVEATI
nr:fatty-acid amide hydrolase 1-like [Gorilla gorilla gorilla]